MTRDQLNKTAIKLLQEHMPELKIGEFNMLEMEHDDHCPLREGSWLPVFVCRCTRGPNITIALLDQKTGKVRKRIPLMEEGIPIPNRKM